MGITFGKKTHKRLRGASFVGVQLRDQRSTQSIVLSRVDQGSDRLPDEGVDDIRTQSAGLDEVRCPLVRRSQERPRRQVFENRLR